VKKDTFEWITEKATELGVTDVVPVIAERSEKKNLNEERLKKISVEASEQSGRGDVPIVHPIISLEEAMEKVKQDGMQTVVFHLEGDTFHTAFFDKNNDLAVFIGPEGGWSEREVEMFHTNGFAVRSLGDQVLRSETAVIAALSQVVFGA
jgi:16S rRNA (uracil1498-N3)-methyltransferase